MTLMLILLQTATDVYCTWDSCEGEDTLSESKVTKVIHFYQTLFILVETSSELCNH